VRAVAAIAATVAIAACGASSSGASSSSGSQGSTGPSGHAAGPRPSTKLGGALAYAGCMRSHGVPSFPDPKQVAGGIQILGAGPEIDRQSPAFRSAQRSCGHLLPGGVGPSGPQVARAEAQLLRVSRCMRAHGFSGFPDPTAVPPSRSSKTGYSDIQGHDGAFLAIPGSIDIRSPAFVRAAGTCHLSLP
jgi:hypothetical protein